MHACRNFAVRRGCSGDDIGAVLVGGFQSGH
jgi:hypothetical protein